MSKAQQVSFCTLIVFLTSITLICGFKASIPKIKFNPESLKTITSWRIVGPFKLPENEQSYTLENEKNAFNRDYLSTIGGREAPFKIGKPTSRIKIEFERDSTAFAPSADKSAPFTFLNQNIDFPVPQVSSYMIFSTNSDFFKIMYSIADIEADKDSEMVLIVSGNSPTKFWINNSAVAISPGGSVGNAQQIQHLVRVHLKQGSNYLVAKMFCFPYLNEFCVRIAGEKSARAFIQEKAGIRDVLETVMFEPDKPLQLTRNLLFFANSDKSESKYEIFGFADNAVVQSGSVALKTLEIPIQGLSKALYTLNLYTRSRTYSQIFYVGLPEEIYPAYRARCDSLAGHKDQIGGPCLSLAGLQEIHKDVQTKGFRQDWQKKAIVYASMIEAGMNPDLSGFRMHAYYSNVDGQYQYFFYYTPRMSKKHAKLPVVVEVPHNAYGAIVSQDPEALVTKESGIRKTGQGDKW